MSEKIYRVALVGFCHMHINSVAGYYYEHPRTQIVAAADTKPYIPELNPDGMFARNWNKAHCVKKFEIPKVYDNYLEMLDAEKPDFEKMEYTIDGNMSSVGEKSTVWEITSLNEELCTSNNLEGNVEVREDSAYFYQILEPTISRIQGTIELVAE